MYIFILQPEAVEILHSDVSTDDELETEQEPPASPACDEEEKEVVSDAIDALNKSLNLIGNSPIKKDKISQKRYSSEKIEKITNAISDKLFNVNVVSEDVSVKENDESGIVEILKDEFNRTSEQSTKIRILTIFKDWSFRKILHHFPSATTHMITVAKKTAEEKGILSNPNPKSHPSLDKDVITVVTNFYELDENSRMLPGKKDFVSVKKNGERVHVQKRLLLVNLKELYTLFKEKYPLIKCSFSKFATLRPKHCVLAGASGTHSVCVCAIHENVKLLIDGSNIKSLTANTLNPIRTYHDCLKQMVCENASTSCYFGNCLECPGATSLIDELESIFETNFIEQITYRQWTNVDRTTLTVMVSPVDEYLEKLKCGLEKLLLHSFLVKKQNDFVSTKKIEMTENECIVMCDFSENYAFVVQNSVQGVHWNNNQATIHPFAIYYKINDEVEMKSFVVISDCLHHDTVAVHVFQRHLVHFIKEKCKKIDKIIYFSDGASAQYKNKKKIVNLTHHRQDFGLEAEWHFFPTSHGKGACDGLGGTLKRLAARTSLQRINNPIQTPKELFEWAVTALPNMSLKFVDKKEYVEEEKKLEARFKKAVTVKGTLSFHCIIPMTKKKAKVKHFSSQINSTDVKIMT